MLATSPKQQGKNVYCPPYRVPEMRTTNGVLFLRLFALHNSTLCFTVKQQVLSNTHAQRARAHTSWIVLDRGQFGSRAQALCGIEEPRLCGRDEAHDHYAVFLKAFVVVLVVSKTRRHAPSFGTHSLEELMERNCHEGLKLSRSCVVEIVAPCGRSSRPGRVCRNASV